MFDELWSEIADAPGEIFDVIEYKEEWEKDDKFDVESYIKGNTVIDANYVTEDNVDVTTTREQ